MAPLRNLYALLVVALFTLNFAGCAGKKAALKDGPGTDATDGEKKEFALRLFKEGAELLYADNQAALTKFDQARELDPSLIAAYYNAGVALQVLGQPNDALARYEACLAQDKQNPNCLDNWVLQKAELGQFDEAEVKVEQYLAEYPEVPFAMVAAAKLAFARKDYSRAERYARQAIEREAENVEALYVMARIFYERKQYPASKWVIKNALEIAPSHGGLHLALGHTDTALGLLHDALDAYTLAVKEEPTDEALEAYGLLLLKRGRVTEALPVLKRLSEQRPEDARNLLHLGNAYMANKMFDEAKSAYLSALEKKPDDLEINFNLGLLYYDLKPKELSEIDRLKSAKSYFEAFMKKPGLSKDRQEEVKEYLRIINQKIEMEEYAAESAKAAAEEAAEEQGDAEGEQAPKEDSDQNGNNVEPPVVPIMPKEEAPAEPTIDEGAESEKDRSKKTKEQEEKGDKKKSEQPEGFDAEEDDFLEDL